MSHSASRSTSSVPEPVARVADLMATFPAPWALCGGWAVDAWLGRQTREHGDTDVSVLAQHQRALVEHLAGWQLVAHDAGWEPNTGDVWWDGARRLAAPAHIHARPPELSGPMPEGGLAWAKDGFTLEFYIDRLDGDGWVLSPEPRVSLPLRDGVRQSPWGLPTVVPEVLLFFKATAYFGREELVTGGRYQDEPDFIALLPRLTERQRTWLSDAISRVYPGHPWLAQLSGEAEPSGGTPMRS